MKKRKPSLRRRIEERANWRCEYCHAPARVSGYRFHLEHIVPESKSGSDGFANRALACAQCNLTKLDRVRGIDFDTGAAVRLFNPRLDLWDDHFQWDDELLSIVGLTAIGRATVVVLELNDPVRLDARELWFATGWLP